MQTRKRDTDTYTTGVFPKANVIAVLLVAIGLLFLPGCRNPFGRQDAAGAGVLSLTIGGQAVGRTIMPEDISVNDIARYEFEFTAVNPPGGDNFTIVFTKNDDGHWTADRGGTSWHGTNMARIELDEGTWNLTVTAFLDREGGGGYVVARGSLAGIAVLPGETVAGNLALFPIADTGGGGQGTFCWEIGFSAYVTAVSMEIMRVYADGTTVPHLVPFFLGLDTDGTATDYRDLPVGRYLVVFTLYPTYPPQDEYGVEVRAILHIYRNLISRFTGEDVFPDFSFPRSLLCHILDAWEWDPHSNTGEWDFVGHGITAGHFVPLGISGIDTMNFGAVAGRFNTLSYHNRAPDCLDELKALVDAALIDINMDRIIATIAGMPGADQGAKETAIRALSWFAALNTDPDYIEFDWDGDTVTVTVLDIYAVEIDFAEDPGDITWSVDPYNDPYTTAIDFTFSAAVEGLTVNQVTVINGTGAAATNPAIPPVILDDDGKRWRVAVNTTMAGTVVVAINRPGVESSPTPITVSGPHIGWDVTTVGTPTSAVVFTFDDPVITGLEQHHFSILPGTASVTWGNLTGGGNTWTLEVNEVVTAGNISVRIIRDGVVNKEQTVTVSSGLNFIDTPSTLSAGRSHAVAVGTDGSIFVWGHRHTSGSSYGSVPTRRVVGLVPQLDGWKSVAAGQSHTMAIRETDGSLWGWGANSFGQLGNGGNANLPSAVIVPGGHSWRFVTAGGNHTVAIRADGTLWAWGDNGYGQLGNGTTSGTVNSPVQVGTYSDWRFVSAGESHTVAIRADGTLWAWGNNEFGRLGLGGDDETNRNTPHQVQSGTTWALASAGTEHTVAITADGTILAWGASWGHRLGIGDGWNATPTPILGTEAFTWRYVSTGYDHTIAIRGDGSLWGWGFNSHGQVRAEGAQVVALSSITIPEGPTDWARVSTGHNYTIATGTDGTLWSWGYNTGGQLGRGVSPPASGQVVVP